MLLLDFVGYLFGSGELVIVGVEDRRAVFYKEKRDVKMEAFGMLYDGRRRTSATVVTLTVHRRF